MDFVLDMQEAGMQTCIWCNSPRGLMNADVVIGHIGDKPVGIATWIVLIWIAFMVTAILAGWFTS